MIRRKSIIGSILATVSICGNVYAETNDQKVAGILTAYSNLLIALESQDIKAIQSMCLSTNIEITTTNDPNRWVASDINLPFIATRLSKGIMHIEVQNSTIGLVRTSTTAFWFSQDDKGKWKLNKYLDKPIK